MLGAAPPPPEAGLGVDPRAVVGEPAGPPLAGEELEARTQALASVMRCPVCQGLSIADSPVDSAVSMRRQVRDLLAAGFSEEQILDYFERSYGEFIRLVPKPEGFNWAVWIAPGVALAIGVGLVAWRLRRGGRGEPEAGPPPELDPYLERVRREVSG